MFVTNFKCKLTEVKEMCEGMYEKRVALNSL